MEGKIDALISLLSKPENLARSLKKEDNNVIYEIIEKINRLTFPNKLTKLAFKKWIKVSFKPEDFDIIEGHYVDKRSTHVDIETIGYLENELLHHSIDGNDWYSYDGKREIVIEKWETNSNIKIIIDKFINCYMKQEDDIDFDEIDSLKQYFAFYIWQNHSNILPTVEQNFTHLNY